MSDVLTLDQIASRFSELPGAKLIGWQQVALPVFQLRLRVVVIDRQPISPIDQFLLRALSVGIENNVDLSQFLGLDIKTVEGHLADLHRAELLSVTGGASGDTIPVSLTPRGLVAAKELATQAMEEQVVKIHVHGIGRQPMQAQSHEFLTDLDCEALDIPTITPMPAKRPSIDELDIDAVSKILRPAWKKQGRDTELVTIKDVEREGKLRFESALMLEYQVTGSEARSQYSFVVNGERRVDYDVQFAKRGGAKSIGARIAFIKDLSERERATSFLDVLPTSVDGTVNSDVVSEINRAVAVEQQRDAIQESIRDAGSAEVAASGKPDTRQRQAARIAELEAELLKTEGLLQGLSVSLLRTNDCDKELYKAVAKASKRVIIVSGTVSPSAVDNLIPALDKAVGDRGVEVWIGYGMNKNTVQGQKQRGTSAFEEAVASLKQFQKRWKDKVRLGDWGNSHSKILVCDDEYVVVGSFNWLSHKPVGMRIMREHAVKVANPECIAAIIKECESQFAKTK